MRLLPALFLIVHGQTQSGANLYGATNVLSGTEPLGPVSGEPVVYGQVPGHFVTRAITTQVANPLPQPVLVLPSPTPAPLPYFPIQPAPTPNYLPYFPVQPAPTPMPYIPYVPAPQPTPIPYVPAPIPYVVRPAPAPIPYVPVQRVPAPLPVVVRPALPTYGVVAPVQAPVIVTTPVPAPVVKKAPRRPPRKFFFDYDYDDSDGFDLAAAAFYHAANGCKDVACGLGSVLAGKLSTKPLTSLAIAAITKG